VPNALEKSQGLIRVKFIPQPFNSLDYPLQKSNRHQATNFFDPSEFFKGARPRHIFKGQQIFLCKPSPTPLHGPVFAFATCLSIYFVDALTLSSFIFISHSILFIHAATIVFHAIPHPQRSFPLENMCTHCPLSNNFAFHIIPCTKNASN
jgi:hypothetical protein